MAEFKRIARLSSDLCNSYKKNSVFKELSKLNVKISVIPNGLGKYMAFTINRKLVFIDSMQFMNSSLDSLVKNLGDKVLSI